VYLAKSFRKRATKKTPWVYYFLRESVWNPRTSRPRHIYKAYIGPHPVLTLEKAQKIAEKIGCTIDELKRVRGLKIIES